ncbi:hypothetical protein mru_0787 [Methanobrevibacter ruminantium M1]|uniref:Uncharacterized protein n=1 Tax=Methanobrevibacter ruminantium (strain ATCC 35063 / DSM 1093 / JCM 13430 / OCM 146 / M1) TaxID=634498 RepID=D3E277_METRM|nr:hypothetical protein [Methanobrevibacter ruminantium]ADC46638.1 hypothetical protein mru_0787 [Methanobrevibacter ruminantium M1]
MKKIILGTCILFLLISVAYAGTVDIFTAPSPLQPLGNSGFGDGQGHNIQIFEFTENLYKTWFENDTDYVVEKYEGNNGLYLYADDENDCGILEIVEKDGKKYIVNSWTPKGPSEAQTVVENLHDFNELNHLTPITTL